MNGSNKIAGAIVIAGFLIAAAYAISHRYEYTPFQLAGLQYVVKHDKWTGRSCIAAGHKNAITFIEVGFC